MKRLFALLAFGAALALGGNAIAQTPAAPPAAATSAAPTTAPAAAPAAAAPAAPTPAPAAAPAPTPNKGDVSWMLVSTALVLMMSVPALALFYGGMVRSKNMLSMLMQVFVVFSLVTVLWCVYGYSLAFTEGNDYFGGFSRIFLKGTFDPLKGDFANV
ncbi:MAG: ammonia channel protein, partial [Bacillota bacterium]